MTIRKKPDPATDARPMDGSALEIWAFGWQTSLAPIARFIRCVESGRPPPDDVAREMASALRVFFCHRDTEASLHEFARKLGLGRKQGKRAMTADEGDEAAAAVLSIAMREFEMLASGKSARIAEATAMREFSKAESKPLRTVQGWWKDRRETARAVARAATAPKRARNPPG